MSTKQITALAILVGLYYWWHWKTRTGSRITVRKGMFGGVSPNYGANTFGVGANTDPTSQPLTVGATTPNAGSGRGFMFAPTKNIAQLNAPRRSTGIGTRGSNWWISKRQNGFGTGGISPTWPTTQVFPTKSVKINSGSVQVPYYAAVPTVTRGLGGQGSVLWGGN